MIDKVVIFDVWGDYGYFRKGYTTTSTLSYPFPSRTTLAGIVSGILGYDRDSYYDIFGPSNSAFALQLLNPIKKVRMNLNLVDTKTGFILSDNKGQRTQLPAEFLKDVKYRIYLWLEDESIMNDLLNFLSNHKSVYTPYLGISECLANVELVNDDFIKPRENYANGNDLSINSVIPTNKAKIKIEPGKKYGAVKSPAFINSERVVERFQEFFYEENGLNITIAEGKCHSVGDINVIFF
ncbi:MAG: type I-B CRISPR-associated protein Cas5b [Euryarchaeota archaeon]|jgi:CRISPR-associated protein Cas5h|nr:type I-B CRISPR-associated protein Cas5b [Euryarchaeota archaeon]